MTQLPVVDELKTAFGDVFGLPMPAALLPSVAVVRIEPARGASLLVGSMEAASRQYLLQSEIEEFLQEAPPGYYLTGFWGHGTSSHAYYYCRVDHWSRVFFRLQRGGIYGDGTDEDRQVREFLVNYLELEDRLRGKAKTLLAIDSMHLGRYQVVMPDGRSCEFKHSLYRRPQFMNVFGHLLP